MDTIEIKAVLKEHRWYYAPAYWLIWLGCILLGFKFEVAHGDQNQASG